jgi:hypothetical protein|tara:strand:- start:72 stop:629 length:558 start_codon:yes stop_codon:yes gene_type:complete
MGKKYLIYIIGASILFIILDVFSRFLFQQNWFNKVELKYEMGVFEISALILSSVITIYLGLYITKRLTEKRYEKELLLSDLININKAVEEMEKTLEEQNTVPLQFILDLSGRISKDLTKFIDSSRIFETNINNTEIESFYQSLYGKVTDIDGTETPIDFLGPSLLNEFKDFYSSIKKTIHRVNCS